MAHGKALAIAFFALAALVIGAETASASCVMRGGRFDPAQNDAPTWSAAVSDGACTINFRSLGNMVFTGTTLLSRPSGGSIAMAGNTSANYRARAGFRGSDSVAFKVCGSHRGGAGCSTITVQLSVQ